MFENKTILITGGTGSFGKTMAVEMLREGCTEIRIFSRDELKQHDMRTSIGDDRIKYIIGDVRSRDAVFENFRGVDYVFHAAALKQVPSCEYFPNEAVQTNVIGSKNVIDASIANGVISTVCLGTDKAVYPINAMGMTKALMEKMAVAASRNAEKGDPVVCSIRYGNVMYSRGSVIPFFINQIERNVPITVTEPKMTRFMLSLTDAVQLVKHALKNGEPGEIFIRKAPSCTVMDLALALKELFDSDVPIKTIGIRHGEKIHETLANKEELIRARDDGQHYIIPPDNRGLNYNKFYSEGKVDEVNIADYTSENTTRLDVKQTKELLVSLPEIRSRLENL